MLKRGGPSCKRAEKGQKKWEVVQPKAVKCTAPGEESNAVKSTENMTKYHVAASFPFTLICDLILKRQEISAYFPSYPQHLLFYFK